MDDLDAGLQTSPSSPRFPDVFEGGANTSEFADYALDGASPDGRRILLANGYEPIPIKGKFPRWEGWSSGEITRTRLDDVEASYRDHNSTGLRTGRLSVVDIDLRDPDHAAAVSEAIRAVVGDTLFRRVGRKGEALCYFNPEPLGKITVSGIPPGSTGRERVEFLGEGQQMAAYGVHPDTGRHYLWPNSFMDCEPLATPLEELPEVSPESLREAAWAARETLRQLGYEDLKLSGAGEPAEGEPSQKRGRPVTREMLENMLARIDPSCDRSIWIGIAGGIKSARVIDPHTGGVEEGFDGLCLFTRWSAGHLTEDRAAPSNYQGENDCEKTWNSLQAEKPGGSGVGTIVFHAQRGGYQGPTAATVDLFGSPEAPDQSGHDGTDRAEHNDELDRPLTAAELASGDYPRAEYLWDGLLSKDHVNLLYGDGGTGKTLLALQVAVAVASGRALFGRAVKKMPVLLVLAEDDYGETKHRLKKVCEDLEVRLEDLPLTIWCRPGDDSTLAIIKDDGRWDPGPFLAPLKLELERIGPCFCLLDTVADIASLDETKRLPVNSLCKRVLGGLCRDKGITILLNAHPSKASLQDGSHYSGSTAWNNSVRNRLVLEVSEDRDQRVLKVAKSNYGPKIEIKLHLWPDDVFHPVRPRDQHEREARERDAVLAVVLKLIDQDIRIVRSNGSGQKPRDVANAVRQKYGLHLTPNKVLDHLHDLERQGKLVYEGADNSRRNHRAGFQRGPNA